MKITLTNWEKNFIEKYNSGEIDKSIAQRFTSLLGDDINKRNQITVTLKINDIIKANFFLATLFMLQKQDAENDEEIKENMDNTGVAFMSIEYDPKLHNKSIIFDSIIDALRNNGYEIKKIGE